MIKLETASQTREGRDLANLSGSFQQILLALASLPEGCWFLSKRRHITRHIKMQSTQLLISDAVLLDKLHWRSSLCQECKSRLRKSSMCQSDASTLFNILWPFCSNTAGLTQLTSQWGTVSFQFRAHIIWGSVPTLPGFCSNLWVSSLQFIWCGQLCFQGTLSSYFWSIQLKKL